MSFSNGAARSGLFIAVTLLYWTSMYIYLPTLTPYLNAGGYSLSFIGIVLGSYGFTQMLVRFPLGVLSDRLGKRKPFILLGMAAACLSCLLFLLPGGWVWPLAGRIVAGICASAWVAFTVLYASYFESGQIGRAMGRISVMTVSGQMIGMLLSGALSEGFGPRAPFLAGALCGAAGLLLAMLIREPAGGVARENGGMSLAQVGTVVRNRTLLRVSLLSILAHGVLFITMFGFTPLKAEQLGAGGVELTLLVFAFMLPHALASFAGSHWLVPRFGSNVTIAIGFVVSACCTAGMIAAPSLGILYATQALNGFAQGLHMPLLLGLAIRDVDSSSRATAMGLYQALYAVGMFSGPFLAGYLNGGWGLDGGFLFGTALALAAAVLTWSWAVKDKREAARLKRSSESADTLQF
ncbi:MFS transporter [Paenibacillus soyae]|uniref:MFS transporter n=1 Tax=Paenibacillus soyae TaxID=2969249 RepID=A0A9X2S9F9_9BACL|nr:MFS transporter [Paenibacillus soyae]MCR2805100.1 MFS transporter [Paenibacillus soyae]